MIDIISNISIEPYAMRVTATEFQQNVGRYQDAAVREPVTITKYGRDQLVLMSMDLFNAVMKGRVARRIEDLDDATIAAIAAAEVPAEFDHLDKLIEG
jgi:PHD/YefM family antitoxin component YafN of YafNO toxin-antitoxin module